MTKEKFLEESDVNITNVDFSDSKDENGKTDVAAFLVIGDSKKREKEYLESLTPEQIEKPSIRFQQFEIMLTKEQLQFMLSEIEKEEGVIENEGCPSYVLDDED